MILNDESITRQPFIFHNSTIEFELRQATISAREDVREKRAFHGNSWKTSRKHLDFVYLIRYNIIYMQIRMKLERGIVEE